jgi:hypothetical protein
MVGRPGSRLGVCNEELVYCVRLWTILPAYVFLLTSLPLHPLLLGWLLGTALAAVLLAKCWLEIGFSRENSFVYNHRALIFGQVLGYPLLLHVFL